jgi:hypothetical protein
VKSRATRPKKNKTEPFTLGRAAFQKISEIEGLALSAEELQEFEEFDRQKLSPEERRRIFIARYTKSET